MTRDASTILRHLRHVDAERARRASDPLLRRRVADVKAYQQRRFEHTYADLLNSERYRAAAQFFLQELYGPTDFSRRDAEFARVIPALVRLFPADIVDAVAALASLHALSESLDTAMGVCLRDAEPIDGRSYVAAWQRAGTPPLRKQQIDAAVKIAHQLDQLTGRPVLRNTLKMMRAPARTAGLGRLQQFLEAGFETFRAMHGAEQFIATVRAREEELARALFAADIDVEAGVSFAEALILLPPEAR